MRPGSYKYSSSPLCDVAQIRGVPRAPVSKSVGTRIQEMLSICVHHDVSPSLHSAIRAPKVAVF